MNFPKNLYYTPEHEWVKIDGNTAYIGITAFAQHELGDIVFVDIDCVGETITKNQVFGTVEAVKTVSDLFMPLTGEVLEFNKILEQQPELVNSDPYENGWMVKINIASIEEVKELLSVESYKNLIGK